MKSNPPPRPLRIARVIARLNVGGPTRHVVWLTEALNDQQFQSVLITGSVPSGEDDMSDFARERGVEPIVIKEMSRELSARDLITVWKLFRLFRKFKPDIVHTHTAKAGATGRLAGLIYRLSTLSIVVGKVRGCRFVHTFHGHVFHHYYGRSKSWLFLTIERILARIATDRIVVLSEQQLDEIHRIFRVGRREQFRIVPLGIELPDPSISRDPNRSLRAELGIEPNEIVVGIVGRLVAIKNHDMFLTVARDFGLPSGEARIRFVVFGDGPDREKLEQRRRELGLGDQLIFAGLRQPSEIYATINIAALTSLNEGTPLTLIEAMAHGLPVVSTAVGGVVDVLGPVERTDGVGEGSFEVRERGITVHSQDTPGFVTALRYLIENEAVRDSLSARGVSHAQSTYSKGRLVQNIIQTYRELTD